MVSNDVITIKLIYISNLFYGDMANASPKPKPRRKNGK